VTGAGTGGAAKAGSAVSAVSKVRAGSRIGRKVRGLETENAFVAITCEKAF
jgi:hypothetical protein